ncbi:MAG: hypothetical protein Q8P02_04165 [Candidatus Micrarchaeota archaeon]|nr:hypothetical protein [Candidatus Micrarchaeota archaeon]
MPVFHQIVVESTPTENGLRKVCVARIPDADMQTIRDIRKTLMESRSWRSRNMAHVAEALVAAAHRPTGPASLAQGI